MLFFEQNPIGRILSRFSRDVVIFDIVVPSIAAIAAQGFFRISSVVILVAIVDPWLIFVIVICIILIVLSVKKGSRAVIEVQKRELEVRRPINDTLRTVSGGLVTLRTYEQNQVFRQQFINHVELSANTTYCSIISNRWIALRLDIICAIFVIAICFFVLMMKDSIDAGLLILSL